jgi:hypothetical protein
MRGVGFGLTAAALGGVLLAASTAHSAATRVATIDSSGDVGRYTSVAIGADGLGLIAYYDATNKDLKVAHCSDVVCSTATLSTLDSTGDVGQFASVAIGSDGLGLISYYDATNGDLKAAHCLDASCSTASVNTLDTGGDVGQFASIAIGSDGLGLIAYVDVTANVVKVAHCSNQACSAATSRSVGVAFFSTYRKNLGRPSVAIGPDGLGLISVPGFPLGIVHCTDVPCSTSTTGTLNDLNGGGARGVATVFGSGPLPRIVWSLALIPELLVYQCGDAACTNATLGRETPLTGNRLALALDAKVGADGQLLVAFEHRGYGPVTWLPTELRVLHCTDNLCTAGARSTVDVPGNAVNDEVYPSLAIGADGFGLISYYDVRNGDLRVAHCGNAACSSPGLSIGDVTVTVEGQAGSVLARFPVTLSPASDEAVTVDYATRDGTARAPVDYESASGTLTFAPGETVKAVEVVVPGSAVPRPDLTFAVDLSNPVAALLARGQAVGTIQTRIPAFAVSSPWVHRGSSGTTLLRFLVTLFPAISQAATVRASTVTGGTATEGVDYVPTTAVLTFAAGETEKYLEVPVIGQPWGEPDETVVVKLTEPVGAPILQDTGTGTIVSAGVAVTTVSIQDVSITEGNAGEAPVVFTLGLSPASGETVTVAYHTEDGTARAGLDYVSASGAVTFPPGALTRTVRVFVKGNTTVENDRTFSLALGPATNAALARSQALGTIRDDDLTMSFSANPVRVPPGGSSTLRWSAPSGATLSLEGQAVPGPEGSREVFPTSTRPYVLQATLSEAVATRRVTVHVDGGSAGLGVPAVTAPAAGATVLVSGVTLSWTAVAGAFGYDLQILDAADGDTLFSGSLAGETSTSTLVSLPDGRYVFAVRACWSLPAVDTSCGRSGEASFIVERVVPGGRPAVTRPAAGARFTESTQTLSWTEVAGDPRLPELFYEVLLEDVSAGVTALQITVPHPTTSTIFTLASSTEYRLRVRACQAGCGEWSDPVTFSVSLPGVPAVSPTGIACDVSGGNSLVCSWDPASGADAYRVQVVQPPPAGPGGGALTVAARQVSTPGATLPVPAGIAAVFVAACNGDGCGPYAVASSAIGPVGPNPTTPNLGTPMGGTVVDGPGVFFSWNRVPGDDGMNTWYRLFVQDLSRQATALDVYTTQNYWAAYFKAEGARYDGRVVANPGLGTEAMGPAQGFNVAGASATAPTMVSPGHNSMVKAGNIQLGWSPVPGATLYEYYVAVTGTQSASALGVTPGLLAQVPLAGSTWRTLYSGIVRACPAGATCAPGSDAGWGPWSNAPGGPGVTNFTVTP